MKCAAPHNPFLKGQPDKVLPHLSHLMKKTDQFSIYWMKSPSRWFHYTDILWCTGSKTWMICFILQVDCGMGNEVCWASPSLSKWTTRQGSSSPLTPDEENRSVLLTVVGLSASDEAKFDISHAYFTPSEPFPRKGGTGSARNIRHCKRLVTQTTSQLLIGLYTRQAHSVCL
jgi:hypothetical protein